MDFIFSPSLIIKYLCLSLKSSFIYISDVINSALLTSDETGTLSSLLAVVKSKDFKNIM